MHIISIIDDNTSLLTNLEIGLKNRGYGVNTFKDPIDALNYLKKDPSDFILSNTCLTFLGCWVSLTGGMGADKTSFFADVGKKFQPALAEIKRYVLSFLL